jgi:formylglycine-generating enzyme
MTYTRELQTLCRAMLWVVPLSAACSTIDSPKRSGVETPCRANDECPAGDDCVDGTCSSQGVTPEGGKSSVGGTSASGETNIDQPGRSSAGMNASRDGGGDGAGGDGLGGDGPGGDGPGGSATLGSICVANQPTCDGNGTAICNANGTGYLATGARCLPHQTCLAGVCHDQQCEPSTSFCSGNSLRRCADDGLASAELAACGDDHYCDAASASCKADVCAPNRAVCDGRVATTCNAVGSGYVAGGTLCDSGYSCDAGECKPQVCTPSQTWCQGQDVKTCSANGLTSTLDKTCTNQMCVVTGGRAGCQGVCAPLQKQCALDGLRACANGQWGLGTACDVATPYCYSGTCNADVAPPSCTELEANCGPSSDESCCTSPLVTGGTFNRSNDPSYPATISSFRLDKYEVTVGRFRKFVAAVVGGWTPAEGSGKHTHLNSGAGLSSSAGAGNELGWDATWNADLPSLQATWDGASNLGCAPTYQTWTPTRGANETKPINCVSWFQSAAFCIWDAGFLPSESEWNYAAAGGSAQSAYPWGEMAPGLDADLAVYGCYFNGGGTCTGVANIAPVGSIVAGNGLSYGQADLAGSVFEWTQDWSARYSASCSNCASLQIDSDRSIRGGSFYDYSGPLLSSHRAGREPDKHNFNIGVRCARTP